MIMTTKTMRMMKKMRRKMTDMAGARFLEKAATAGMTAL